MTRKYYVISLPRIETRYTGQWRQWAMKFSRETNRQDIVVLGNNRRYELAPSEFLNYRDYFGYVYPQLVNVIRRVKSGDVVFFMDGETAGVEAFEYLRKMEGIDIEIRTFWHSGTYDATDLTAQRDILGESFECGWFDITEKIYVSSRFHADLLCSERGVPRRKIIITGCPLDLGAFYDGLTTKKKRRFLYAGRKSAEKGYDDIRRLQDAGVDVTVSLDNDWGKDRFYREIAASEMMIIPAKQETFGIAMMEALASGVPVMASDSDNYQTIPAKYRVPRKTFSDHELFIQRANDILVASGGEKVIAEQYDYKKVIGRWLE